MKGGLESSTLVRSSSTLSPSRGEDGERALKEGTSLVGSIRSGLNADFSFREPEALFPEMTEELFGPAQPSASIFPQRPSTGALTHRARQHQHQVDVKVERTGKSFFGLPHHHPHHHQHHHQHQYHQHQYQHDHEQQYKSAGHYGALGPGRRHTMHDVGLYQGNPYPNPDSAYYKVLKCLLYRY